MKLFYPGSFTCPITGADLNSIHLNTKVPTSVTEQLIARSTDIQSSFYVQPGERPARANPGGCSCCPSPLSSSSFRARIPNMTTKS